MGAPLLVRVSIVFVDRGGKKATISFLFPASISPLSAIAWAKDTASVIEQMSDAKPIQAKYEYKHTLDDTAPAGFSSDNTRRAILFYRNEDEIEAITIPSASITLLEGTGKYQGIRVDALATAVISFNAAIQSIASSLATKEGEPFPTEYVVGGLAV